MFRIRLFILIVPLLATCFLANAFAQGSRADYERADRLRDLTRNKVFKTKVEPHWLADKKRFWYRNDLGGGASEFIFVDAEAGRREAAFDHAKLAAALSKETGKEASADRLPFQQINIADDGGIRFTTANSGWRFDPQTNKLSKTEKLKAEKRPRTDRRRNGNSFARSRSESPDGRWLAEIKDHNVHVREKDGDASFALTKEGTTRACCSSVSMNGMNGGVPSIS